MVRRAGTPGRDDEYTEQKDIGQRRRFRQTTAHGQVASLLTRKGITYSKNGSQEDVQAWLEEMKRTLQLKEERIGKKYEDIRAACEEGREENLAKYRSMSDEARTAAAAARAQRDAAETKIRKLQAKLGIVKKKEWWEL